MTSIRKEIMELRQQFYVYDAEGNPEFGLPWFTEKQDLERLESFLSSALTRIEEKTREETIKGLRKTFDSDLQKAFEEKDIEKSSNAGYALEVFERATKLLLSPSEEKESHCVIREGYEMHAKDCHCSEEKETKSDLLPFKHGEEGIHFACKEKIGKLGGFAWCCGCNGHKCKSPQKEGKE